MGLSRAGSYFGPDGAKISTLGPNGPPLTAPVAGVPSAPQTRLRETVKTVSRPRRYADYTPACRPSGPVYHPPRPLPWGGGAQAAHQETVAAPLEGLLCLFYGKKEGEGLYCCRPCDLCHLFRAAVLDAARGGCRAWGLDSSSTGRS